MAKSHDLEVEGGNVYPEELHVETGDKISWNPATLTTTVEIDFDFNGLGKTPVEWKYKKENPGVPVKGKVKKSAAGQGFPYQVGMSRTLSGPEIIVDSGLRKKRRSAKATTSAKSKRTKRTKLTKPPKRTKNTKRAKR